MFNILEQNTGARLKGKRIIKQWINNVLKDRGLALGEVNVLFCTDPQILKLNNESLGHNYYTDIITFDYRIENIVSGDLFISLDTILANSKEYRQMYAQKFECELCHVIVHGILHICGEDDHTPTQQKKMRSAENKALKMLEENFLNGDIKISYRPKN
ncbi:MAG: rRNA maturation RNase YbeY [Bacteroidales bacterium]|nr:rRNA maturation RNase YbeY [Bacteroidales bacterium]